VRYFLDTDIFNHFCAGHPRVLSHAAAAGSTNLAITVVTRMEVLRGRFEFLRKAANATELKTAQRRLDESDQAIATWRIVPLDGAACDEFERLRTNRALRKIGRADLLIACVALANGATLASRNVRDFKLVPGLRIENWVD
jgi:tRNA(fMet)-specific endonuclease VapC